MVETLSSKVYEIVAKIPKGKVLTYGKIAELAGMKSPRLVGRILHQNSDPINIPCHRVVNSSGKVSENYAFGGGNIQREKLEKEGIVFVRNRVEMDKYLWK